METHQMQFSPNPLLHMFSCMYSTSLASQRKCTVYAKHLGYVLYFKISTTELTSTCLLRQMFILSAPVYFSHALNIYQLKLLTERFLNECRALPRVLFATPLLLCASTKEPDNFK